MNRKVVKAMKKRLNLFNQDQSLKDQAFNRYVALMTDKAEKKEYHDMGIQEGLEQGMRQGMKQGKLDNLIKISAIKYPNQNLS